MSTDQGNQNMNIGQGYPQDQNKGGMNPQGPAQYGQPVGQPMESQMPRDPNVLNFMMQAVQEKNGNQVDAQFLQKEAERLYDEFGEKLVDYFEPMLSKEQVEQFDQMIAQNATQEQLLAFLMSCIPDLTQQIEKVLLDYRDKYVHGV